MSGGVDSSVAAALLHDEGWDVVGLTMKTWDHATTGGRAEAKGRQIGCCTLESMNDARSVAVARGFPHYVVDLREEFGDSVISRFTSEYLAGRTPNPCILCNTHVKWDALLRRADSM
jgi:tRNA-specific 2-thiouridylase